MNTQVYTHQCDYCGTKFTNAPHFCSQCGGQSISELMVVVAPVQETPHYAGDNWAGGSLPFMNPILNWPSGSFVPPPSYPQSHKVYAQRDTYTHPRPAIEQPPPPQPKYKTKTRTVSFVGTLIVLVGSLAFLMVGLILGAQEYLGASTLSLGIFAFLLCIGIIDFAGKLSGLF